MIGFIIANWEWLVPSVLIVAEGITRITPTEKDDGFVKRIGAAVDFVMNNIKFPNRLK
jgi:hypothetical protein